MSTDELRALIQAQDAARVREAELRDRMVERLERDVAELKVDMRSVRVRTAFYAGAAAVMGVGAGFALRWLLAALTP